MAQVTVNNTTLTVEQYIQTYLIGSGVTISNVQFNAGSAAINNEQVGAFLDVNLDTGIPYGIILGSGNVSMAAQLNTGGGSSLGGGTGMGSDSALASITPNTIFDECVVEFDFVPVGDTIKFNYVFASEEYDEYVCGSVNDAFGFFLSGPNPLGGNYSSQNLALIPDPLNPGLYTTTPVSINTVNLGVAGSNGLLSNCTNIDSNFADYSIFYTQNTTNTYEYDGRTVVLEARSPVICGQTYHIKLAIGDAGDGALDSGVFIEGGSFSSEEVIVDVLTTTGDSAIVEGCNSARINFIRTSNSDSLTVHFSLGGSTATNGVDYVTIIDSVTFVPGSDTVSLIIIPLADGITEGIEVITITAITFNACGDTIISTGNIYIIDVPDMKTFAPDTTLYCAQDSIYIWAQGSQATPPFSYEWFDSQGNSLGIDSNYAYVPGSLNDTFYVDISDSCNSLTLRDTVIVSLVFAPLSLAITPDTNICAGDSILIQANVTGGIPPYNYQWSNGLIGVDSFWVSTVGTSVFSVTVTDSCSAVNQVDSVIVSTDYIPMTLSVSNDTLICKNQSIVLSAIPSNGIPDYSYQWAPITSTGANPIVTPSSTTNYYVSVTDLCFDTVLIDSILVSTDFPPLVIDASQIGEVCSGTLVYVEGQASGGNPPYAVYWNYNEQESFSLNFEFVSDYTVNDTVKFYVTDACFEKDSLGVFMVVNNCVLEFPNVFTPNGDGVNDYFHITGLEYFPNNKMSIYNRWGAVIYEIDHYQNTWDGFSESGQAFPPGVYYYVLDILGTEITSYKGSFTLLK